MYAEPPVRRLSKWPFYLADAILCAVAAVLLFRLESIQGTAETVAALGAVVAAAWGAWISILPWLREANYSEKSAELETLKTALEQLRDLENVAGLIRNVNSQWQNIQESTNKTVTSASQLAEQINHEREELQQFLQTVHGQEQSTLRLEIEKLRRMEGEWVKVVVQILDHIYALHQAAIRSGQPALIAQLQHFQTACRDIARRIGLSPFLPNEGESYDPQQHQLPESGAPVPEGATVGQVLACGFTYQGQLIRRALVLLRKDEPLSSAEQATVPGETAEREESSELRETASEPSEELENPETTPSEASASSPEGAEPDDSIPGEVPEESKSVKRETGQLPLI